MSPTGTRCRSGSGRPTPTSSSGSSWRRSDGAAPSGSSRRRARAKARAHVLAFGGLLLFGGRISDLWGRKRAFTADLIGFAAASAIGGASAKVAMLLGARALQGAFGALLAVMSTDAKERAKAFGIYGAIAGAAVPTGIGLCSGLAV
ncbi:MFS transporter [Sphaerisporangium sp. NPDC051017]|uniref:MFS transporter n=1 Tax=Sphaerisporangium sp. NPDC051017 TaxID=3154636 RepID=UPI00344A28D1